MTCSDYNVCSALVTSRGTPLQPCSCPFFFVQFRYPADPLASRMPEFKGGLCFFRLAAADILENLHEDFFIAVRHYFIKILVPYCRYKVLPPCLALTLHINTEKKLEPVALQRVTPCQHDSRFLAREPAAVTLSQQVILGSRINRCHAIPSSVLLKKLCPTIRTA